MKYMLWFMMLVLAGLLMAGFAVVVFTSSVKPTPIIDILGRIAFFTWWIPFVLAAIVLTMGLVSRAKSNGSKKTTGDQIKKVEKGALR